MKIAVLFAGQGAQKPGMGKSLYDNVPEARAVFEQAETVVPGITELCFSGGAAELNKTRNTQPCVFTVDMAAWAAFRTLGLPPQAGAGFSLGEYAALAAAKVLPLDEALRLVAKRAEWMQQAAETYAGGMVAILGKDGEEVEQITETVCGDGLLVPVNYNCPGQTVVAGDEAELDKLQAYAKENRIKSVRLPVGGAFHSEHMRGAADKIYDEIQGMDFGEPEFPLYANKTAKPYEAATMKRVLADQTMSAVLFEQIARDLLANGFDTFVEVGPGSALSGFMKRMGAAITVCNVNDMETLESTREQLTGSS